METFPMPGSGLSPYASVIFPEAERWWPNVKSVFENLLVDEVRKLTSSGRGTSIRAVFIVPQADYNVILAFLDARHGEVEPFVLPHPKKGNVTVRYGSDRLVEKTHVAGSVQWWYLLDVSFRPQYSV